MERLLYRFSDIRQLFRRPIVRQSAEPAPPPGTYWLIGNPKPHEDGMTLNHMLDLLDQVNIDELFYLCHLSRRT